MRILARKALSSLILTANVRQQVDPEADQRLLESLKNSLPIPMFCRSDGTVIDCPDGLPCAAEPVEEDDRIEIDKWTGEGGLVIEDD